MLRQFGPGQVLTLTVFSHGHHCHGVVTTAQQVFGKVQGRAGEPLGAGHLRPFQEDCIGLLMEADVEEVDDVLPEVWALID
ncbi:hypothetical protein D3C73_1483710 [compost metagenome]